MSMNRSAKKLTALALAGAAIAAGAAAAQERAAGSGARPASASGANRGNPNAVPPILPCSTCSTRRAAPDHDASRAAGGCSVGRQSPEW